MSPEEINVKIAESLGVNRLRYRFWYNGHDNKKPYMAGFKTREEAEINRNGHIKWGCGEVESYMDNSRVCNFHSSLDACAQFEAGLTRQEYWNYADIHLREIVMKNNNAIRGSEEPASFACATAPQRCLAYLKTKGLIP